MDVIGIGGFYNAAYDGNFAPTIYLGDAAYPTTYRNKISTSVSSAAEAQKMMFSVANGSSTFNDVMTLTGNGNVGIGTTSPLAKLHVSGHCVTGDTMLPIRRRRKKKLKGKNQKSKSGGGWDPDEEEWDYFLCRIDEILPGDEVLSLNEEYWDKGTSNELSEDQVNAGSGALEYARIHKMMDMGVHDVYELTTKSGRKIRTTAEHPYLIKVQS